MKYGVNRVTLVGNVGEVPRVSEKEGEEISKTEWHQIVYLSGTFISIVHVWKSRDLLAIFKIKIIHYI